MIFHTLGFSHLFGLALTLLVYVCALRLYKMANYRPLAHPILLGALLVAMACVIIQFPLEGYQQSVRHLSWLLGPVTVALAVPLYQQLKSIVQFASPALTVILVGGVSGPILAFGCLYMFDIAGVISLSVLTKSITTPLAMETAKQIGSIPELAAAVVVITGILGVLMSSFVFKLATCTSPEAKGLALGTVAHAIGTASANQLGRKSVAFATMALCVNGVLTAIILPLLMLSLTE